MGIGEWLIIILVAIMFIKPEKAKEYTKVAVKVRKYINDATAEVKKEMKEALAGIEDNSSAVSSTVYVGNTQPLTSSEYLGWLNTTDGLWYYRTDTSSSVWNVASSAWT